MNKIITPLMIYLAFSSYTCMGKVKVLNDTQSPIKVLVHYIGVGSPSLYELEPGKNITKTKDLANIKKRYQVLILKKNKEYQLAVDKKVSDPGAFRSLEVYERKDPSSENIFYGIYSHGG